MRLFNLLCSLWLVAGLSAANKGCAKPNFGCAQASCVEPSRQTVEENRDVTEFGKLRVGMCVEVVVKKADPHTLLLRGDRSFLAKIQTAVESSADGSKTLTVDLMDNTYLNCRDRKCKITVEVGVPFLDEVHVAGTDNSARFEDYLAFREHFAASVRGNGKLSVKVAAKMVHTSVSGGGSLTVEETSTHSARQHVFNAKINGAGSIDAKNVFAKKIELAFDEGTAAAASGARLQGRQRRDEKTEAHLKFTLGAGRADSLVVEAAGKGSVRANHMRVERAHVTVEGAANVDMDRIDATHLSVIASSDSSGRVGVKGTVGGANYEVKGAAKVEAGEARARNVTARLYEGSSGQVRVWATEQLTGRVDRDASGGLDGRGARHTELHVAGAGTCDVDMPDDAVQLDVILAGSGVCRLRDGKTKTANLKLAGSGSINAMSVRARDAKAELEFTGRGDIRVWATRQLVARNDGDGSIVYKGEASVQASGTNKHKIRPCEPASPGCSSSAASLAPLGLLLLLLAGAARFTATI